MRILLWPFLALWALLSFILRLTGRLLALVVGLVLLFAGIFLTMTLVIAPVGIPLAVLGFLLLLRSLF